MAAVISFMMLHYNWCKTRDMLRRRVICLMLSRGPWNVRRSYTKILIRSLSRGRNTVGTTEYKLSPSCRQRCKNRDGSSCIGHPLGTARSSWNMIWLCWQVTVKCATQNNATSRFCNHLLQTYARCTPSRPIRRNWAKRQKRLRARQNTNNTSTWISKNSFTLNSAPRANLPNLTSSMS